MNIYQRVNEVRKKIEYIKKDAAVQGYMAVTHDAVTALVRDHLIEYGIIILADQLTGEAHNVGETKNKATIIRYEAMYQVSFVNMEDPKDMFSVKIQAHANDHGDKAPGKALSYAVKSVILKVFNIETGINDESRMEDVRQGKLVAEHLQDEMREYMDSGDSLAMMLFSRKIGPEMWTDLYNSGTEGKKVALKKKLDKLCTEGQEVLEKINQSLIDGDDLLAKENMSGLTEGGKRLLANHLGREKALMLGNLMDTGADK